MNGTETDIFKANHAHSVMLPDGTAVPQLGQGTWHLANNPLKRSREIETLRRGIDLGMTLIDTAEMYGEGASEKLVGEAIQGIPREKLFLVSKVYPHNAGRNHIFTSCKRSLERLGVSYLDLYLLHWRGNVPLAETVSCMEELIQMGLIRRWGVSNFDVDDMEELWETPGGNRCAVNQVLYHLGSRGIEYDLIPWLDSHKVPVMAYCPLAQAGTLRRGLVQSDAVKKVALAHDATPMQVLLSFLMHSDKVIAIPKASSPEHVYENAQAGLLELTPRDMDILSVSFPPPRHKVPLDMQ
jgi:diketogulonate reductase-like aldo/keto reductase